METCTSLFAASETSFISPSEASSLSSPSRVLCYLFSFTYKLLEIFTRQMVIPVIDFSKLSSEERSKTMAQIAKGCEEWGFFQVQHFIPYSSSLETLIEGREVVSLIFFLSSCRRTPVYLFGLSSAMFTQILVWNF